MPRKAYDTDLTDEEWEICDKILKATLSKRGRKPLMSHRETLDAVFYRTRAGCQWRNLPHDFPPWERIYATYHRWVEEGIWKKLHDALCQEVRKKNNREATPSVLIIDSQSVKADAIAEEKGYDANKKIKGIKRQTVTDTLGLVVDVMVHSAAISDRDGAKLLLLRLRDENRLPRLEKIFADGGYSGHLIEWVAVETGWSLEIVKRDNPHEFVVLPKRWVVERTFGWLMFWRVLNRHHERKVETGECVVRIAMIHNMLRLLTRKEEPKKPKKRWKTVKTRKVA